MCRVVFIFVQDLGFKSVAMNLFKVVTSDSLLNTEFLVRVLELKEVLSTAPVSSPRSNTYWKEESRAIP